LGALLPPARPVSVRRRRDRRRRPSEIALLLGLTRIGIGVLLVALGALLVLPFGLWLVHLERFGYGAAWVEAALALFVVVGLSAGSAGSGRSGRGSWPSSSPGRATPRRLSCGRSSTTGWRSP